MIRMLSAAALLQVESPGKCVTGKAELQVSNDKRRGAVL
jgi:hypothetical protein